MLRELAHKFPAPDRGALERDLSLTRSFRKEAAIDLLIASLVHLETFGFQRLGAAIGILPKSQMRAFSPQGNPQARNLFSALRHPQKRADFELYVARGPQ
jgi:hypothetical protein